MSNPATPLDNQAAITQINHSINFLITEFLRPTALQTQANAVAIDNLTAGLQITRQVVDDVAVESREDRRRSDNRFAEERRLSDKSFNAQMAEMRALGEQNRALLSALAHTNERVDSLEKAS
jgi:hypothetical protein